MPTWTPVQKCNSLQSEVHYAKAAAEASNDLRRSSALVRSFIHSLIAICRAHCVDNVESEVLEAVARWSVIGRVVSFKVVLDNSIPFHLLTSCVEANESDPRQLWQLVDDLLGRVM